MIKWGGENSRFDRIYRIGNSDYWLLTTEFCLLDRIHRIYRIGNADD